jgi:hypothetical protein
MPLRIIRGRPGHYPKRAPIGVYDKDILCSACEAKFSSVDSYGISVLLSKFEEFFRPVDVGGRTLLFSGDEVDAQHLLKFLVSILWRASVSNEGFFSNVALGPFGPIAEASIFGEAVDTSFDAVITRWNDEGGAVPAVKAIMDPIRERWNGVNSYRLYLGRIVAYVKVDSRQFHPPFNRLSLQAGPPCQLISRDLLASKDYQAMIRTVALGGRPRKS